MALVSDLSELKSDSPFYGRSSEIEEINGFLESRSPLIIVQGDGGSGKTTLVDHVLTGYKGRVVRTEVESSHRWTPSRLYASVVMDLLGNPKSPEEFQKNLGGWYGGDRDDESTKLLTAAVWHHHNFGKYVEAGRFTAEKREQGFGKALADFFGNGEYKQSVAVQISNYEREFLGNPEVADELLNTISAAIADKPISFLVETRANLKLSKDKTILDYIPEYPIFDEYGRIHGVATAEIVEHVKRVATGRPYATDQAILIGERVKDLPDNAELEQLLDVNINDLDPNQKKLLQLVSHSQGPMSFLDVAKAIESLGLQDHAIDGFEELIRCKLISADGKMMSYRNPRAAEHVNGFTHTSPEESTRFHELHYGLSEVDVDRFYHASSAKMTDGTHDLAKKLLWQVPSEQAIQVTGTAIKVLNEANPNREDQKITNKVIELHFNQAQAGYNLGRYNLWNGGKIGIARQHLPKDDVRAKWKNYSLDLADNLAIGYFETALDSLRVLRETVESVEGFIESRGIDGDEAKELRGYAAKAGHLGAFLNTDRVCFDDSPNMGDADRIKLLSEGAGVLESQLSTDNNLGFWDKLMLSYVQSTWAMFDPSEMGLLDKSYKNVREALEDPKIDVHNRFSGLANQAQVLMLQGNFDKAQNSISEARVLHDRYSANVRNNIGLLILERAIDKKKGTSDGSSHVREITRLLKEESSPRNFFNYPFWIEQMDEKLST
jgi:tetratricopeptide (TPR) repeat protein